MDARQQDALVQRLVQDPHDQAAIAAAHNAGQKDPDGYANLLEQVGRSTGDPALASHWLTEAANVWLTTFQDAHRAASILMAAVEKDPAAEAPAERLAELYRSSGDSKALAALYDRRARALAALGNTESDYRSIAAGLYEELGRIWSEEPLNDLEKAKQSFVSAIEQDPESQYAIYTLRELYKTAGEFAQALPYFGMEQALVTDSERKLALYADEADVAKSAGDPELAASALRKARQLDAQDAMLKQQLGTTILDKLRAGQRTSQEERNEAAELFVSLAEEFPGEHGFLYALCALELQVASDRAMQLAIHYGEPLQRLEEAASLAAGYVQAKPDGPEAEQARAIAGSAEPPAEPQVAPEQKLTPVAETPPESQPKEPGSIEVLLQQAGELAKKKRKTEAIETYKQVLDKQPTQPEALAYLQEQLPAKRKHAELRVVLSNAVDAADTDEKARVEWLREIAGLCENQLRDFDGAVAAWQHMLQISATAEGARDQLRRLLERARRWDDLASLLKEDADGTEDLEVRISLEKNLAKLHSAKRNDPAAAGAAWARIAELTPGDETPLLEAVKLFKEAERPELAALALEQNVGALDDAEAKLDLYRELAELKSEEPLAAAEVLNEGAQDLKSRELWQESERRFAQAAAWQRATDVVDELLELTDSDEDKASLYHRAAGYLEKVSDIPEVISRLELSVDLCPENDTYAGELERILSTEGRTSEVAEMLLGRAEKFDDPEPRLELRKRAALIQSQQLDEVDAARASFLLVLADGEDLDALSWLADDAERGGEYAAAADYLSRWWPNLDSAEQKTAAIAREAELWAGELEDIAAAVELYERLLGEVDDKNVHALSRITQLELARGEYESAAKALERQLELLEGEEKLEVATRLADLYESTLSDSAKAIRMLSFIHQADPDDFEATQRLCDLAEANGEYALVAELMVELISVEGDDTEVGALTHKLATILSDHLDRSEEALEVLLPVADSGDSGCRDQFIELGDRLGKQADVARRIVAWYRTVRPSPERSEALNGAFERFVEAGEDQEAVEVAKVLAKGRSAQRGIAEKLEELSFKLKDLDALSAAHELIARDIEGLTLGEELARQAEVLVQAGVPVPQALKHGEQALNNVPSEDVELLLERLSALAPEPQTKIDIYERQIARVRAPDAKLQAQCRAAEVAAELGEIERARSFFEVVLTGAVQDDTVDSVVGVARRADERRGDTQLRSIVAQALAAGGQAARDGGRTRARLLRQAAVLAHDELHDADQALAWLTQALTNHVETATFTVLDEIAERVGDFGRAETVLSEALGQVFDGPLVRGLLAKRAEVRQDRLANAIGAAEDLKRLHELSPADGAVSERLSQLYDELGDLRGLVQLHEDQILRGRDPDRRAELARRVALLWQDELADPREAADAWRRVLRMKSGDEEAKAGLAAAKQALMKAKAEKAEQEAQLEARAAEESASSVELESGSGKVAPTEPDLPLNDRATPEMTGSSSVSAGTANGAPATAVSEMKRASALADSVESEPDDVEARPSVATESQSDRPDNGEIVSEHVTNVVGQSEPTGNHVSSEESKSGAALDSVVNAAADDLVENQAHSSGPQPPTPPSHAASEPPPPPKPSRKRRRPSGAKRKAKRS